MILELRDNVVNAVFSVARRKRSAHYHSVRRQLILLGILIFSPAYGRKEGGKSTLEDRLTTNVQNTQGLEVISDNNQNDFSLLFREGFGNAKNNDYPDENGKRRENSTELYSNFSGMSERLGKELSPNMKLLDTWNIAMVLSDSYQEQEFKKGVRVTGSYLSYMGRVQIALKSNQWGAICGKGWTVQDATVVCRQLGLEIGGVIAQSEVKPGLIIGEEPIAMSEVKCRGDEKSLDECPSIRWNGKKSLPCSKFLRASVICGCPVDVTTNVKTRCFVYTGFPYDSLSCHHSCPKNRVLVGDRRRECNRAQKWTGIRPTCRDFEESPRCEVGARTRQICNRDISHLKIQLEKMPSSLSHNPEACLAVGCCYNMSSSPRCYLPVNSPCSSNPCLNGGKCRDYLDVRKNYECDCLKEYAGSNCQFRRIWSCGKQKIKPKLPRRPILRIVGGHDATEGSWPWVVQITLHDEYLCVGALIHTEWVLTAAHCMTLKNAKNGPSTGKGWKVVVGRSKLHEKSRGEEISISYMVHHNYTNDTVPMRDMALFKLSRPVHLDRYANLICLPIFGETTPSPGTKCWIAGWGRTEASSTSNSLKQAGVPIISNEECRSYHNYDNIYHMVNDDMICGLDKVSGADSCNGDSGGPLMCQRSSGTWYVAGIVSWGYKCGDVDSPGVYTRVSSFVNWIFSTMNSN